MSLRIDEDRAVAVVPVEREQSGLARPDRRGFARQLVVQLPSPPSQTTSTHQLRMSPTADCPASMPRKPGMIEPLTMPQMPGMVGDAVADGAIAQSHVEVPMILTSVPTSIPDPTAP